MAKTKGQENDGAESIGSAPTGVEMLRKISAKTVCGKLPKPEKATPLFHLMGVCTGLRTGQSGYGEFVEFSGQFEALNCRPGDENYNVRFISTRCFMPEPVESQLRMLLTNSAAQNSGEMKPVQFAFTVGYKPQSSDKPGGAGYEYTVRSIVAPDSADLLAELRSKMPALPAPTA